MRFSIVLPLRGKIKPDKSWSGVARSFGYKLIDHTALSAINGTLAHLAFVGLHFYAHTRDPGSPNFTGPEGEAGVYWLAKTDNLLFEDMMVQFYAGTNFTIQGDIKNFKLRRSIVVETRLVYYYQMPFQAGTTYTNNQWFSIEDPGKWFIIDMDTQSYDEWLKTSGETGSSSAKNMYVDPTRRLGTYHETLQKDPTFDAYIAEARKQSRKKYRYEYTTDGPLTYIRAGFGKK